VTHEALDTSVVICAYTEDRWECLLKSVESIKRQRVPAKEIIIVIDHNPRLFARAQAHIQDVVIVENTQARGLSGARNSGIAVATGVIIAFLDEDARADEDWLARLSNAYNDPQVVGVGGSIVPLWQSGRPSWFPSEFDWVVGCTYTGMPTTTAPVRNLIGCNMSFRREVFATVGGFRNGIGRVGTRPVGCEETELCIRVRQQCPQTTLYYEPQARVHHLVPDSRARWEYFRARCYAEGLSKALVSRLVGAEQGLSSERTYTLRTLPRGVGQGVRDAFRGQLSGLLRVCAIIAGLALTTTGYIVGRLADAANTQSITSVGSVREVKQ
jgi:GT2 family glycosyltransferase